MNVHGMIHETKATYTQQIAHIEGQQGTPPSKSGQTTIERSAALAHAALQRACVRRVTAHSIPVVQPITQCVHYVKVHSQPIQDFACVCSKRLHTGRKRRSRQAQQQAAALRQSAQHNTLCAIEPIALTNIRQKVCKCIRAQRNGPNWQFIRNSRTCGNAQ